MSNSLIKPIEEMEDMRKLWYHTDAVAFEMVKCMRYRESVFIANRHKAVQRMLKINAVRFLYKNFDRFHFFNDYYMYNVYHSVSHFPNMPMTSFKVEEKQKQQVEFNEKFDSFITGYDLFLDLDNPDFQLVYSSAKRLKNIFDKYQIPYNLIYSGKKGIHITVEYPNLPQELKRLKFDVLANLFKLFAYELKINRKIMDIDTSIFDLRRIKKVAYSVVYPFYRVALPLSDEQFDNFKLADVFLPNLIHKASQMRNRGLLTRKGTPDGLMRLMRDLALEREGTANLFKICKITKETLIDVMKDNHLVI